MREFGIPRTLWIFTNVFHNVYLHDCLGNQSTSLIVNLAGDTSRIADDIFLRHEMYVVTQCR